MSPARSPALPRGKIVGRRRGRQPKNHVEHFFRCDCGAWVDCRDLAQVFAHEASLPHEPQTLH